MNFLVASQRVSTVNREVNRSGLELGNGLRLVVDGGRKDDSGESEAGRLQARRGTNDKACALTGCCDIFASESVKRSLTGDAVRR